ncbi:MAG TPA: rhodanese-like domain-containing protein [Acidobacteriota bacterium]|nr:hypothetical protein [Acidobacteriota bacterium]HOT00666.1 rhodanese-like domain-containing protein [Acidobacteriota bacterium]HQF88361.1 rhodanese-like domain-containing protein [Acidobacteriota bacterium]HQG93067.1 rhodanese-like domain-containing protein [Acidobacteriota bacterium]HQK87632.1 rhodanese-like domain-containing protein [Acidobacteriota bacterium]
MKKSKESRPADSPTPVSPKEALARLQNGATLLDIREAYETNFRVIDVPAVIQVPHRGFQDHWTEIPRDVPLILMDNVGVRSPEIARFLIEKGYQQVAYIIGGVVDWVKGGLPVLVDRNYELVGQCSCKLRPKNPKEEPKWKK